MTPLTHNRECAPDMITSGVYPRASTSGRCCNVALASITPTQHVRGEALIPYFLASMQHVSDQLKSDLGTRT